MSARRDARPLIVWSVLLVVIVFAIAAAMFVARDALILVYISVLLAIGFAPLVHAIERQRFLPIGRRIPRGLAILLIYLAILGTLAGVAFLVVPPLVDQAQQLWQQLPELLNKGQDWLVAHHWISHPLTISEAVQRVPGTPADAAGTVVTAVGTVASGTIAVITVVILTFYMLVESEALFRGFARVFPPDRRPIVLRVSNAVSKKVSAWLGGQLILAAVIGGSSAIALYLIGVPYFYVLAVISGVGETIPVVGPVLSAVPAIAVALTVSTRMAIYVLIFFIVQQQTENHLLVPQIMEHQVGVSAVTVIVALLVGASLLGVLGAVLAVPTAAIIQSTIEALLDERDHSADA